MEFFNQYAGLPSQGHLDLLRYLLVLTFATHFPYIGLVTGATLFSLMFNARDRDIPNPTFARITKDLMDVAVPSRVVVAVFGVLPLLALWLIFGQWLYKSTANTMGLLPFGAALVALSFVPIGAYRATLRPEGRNSRVNFGLGGIGLLALLVGGYVLIGCITRFNDPERWHLARDPVRLMTSFNIIWKFVFFFLSGTAITGCAILFFFFSWSGRKTIEDAQYVTFLKNFGAGVAIASILGIPVVGFFYLVTTPIVAMSGAVYGIAVATVAVLFVVFVYLYRAILSPRPRFGAPAFVLFLLVFALVGAGDQLTLVNATQEHSAALVAEWEEKEAQIALEREARRAAAMKVDPARGEEVFNTVCTTCHRMDERLVGPPLNTVLPKYAGDMDALVKFVSNPVKVDPDYPPMPNPGLPLSDVRSVAAYLLGESGTTPPQPQPRTR